MPNGLTLADLETTNAPLNPETGLQEKGGQETASPLTLDDLDLPPVTPSDSDAYLGRGDFGQDPSEYDFQLRYGADNEEIRAVNQTTTGMLAKGAGRLVGTAATKALQGVGYTLSAVPALLNGDMNVMLDNEWSGIFREVEEDIKGALPIYKTRAYEEGNLGDQMSSLAFWTDDVVDGAAFMLSSMMSGAGINAVSKSAKVYTNLAKQFSRLSRAAKTGRDIGATSLKLKSWADKATRGTITAFNTLNEAAFEAKDVKDSVLRALDTEVQLGRMTQEEAIDKAAKAARTTFLTNMAVLSLSNHLETNMLFKNHDKLALSKIFKPSKAAGDTVEKLSRAEIAGYFTKDALLSAVAEGAYEENIQSALQTYVTNKAEGKENRNLLQGLIGNMVDNFGTTEGQKAIALGAIIGLIPGGIGGVREAKAEQRQRQVVDNARGVMMDQVRNQAQDFYKRQTVTDPKTGKVVGESDAIVVDENNRPVIDRDKLAANFYKSYEGYTDFVESLKATTGGNKTMFDFIKHKRFAGIALEYLTQPGGKEALNDLIDHYAEQEIEDLARAGEQYDEADIQQTKEDYKKLAEELSKVYVAIENNFGGLQEFGKDNIARIYQNKLIGDQYELAAEQLFWLEEAKKYERTIARDAAAERGPVAEVFKGTDVRTKIKNRAQKRLNEIQNIMIESQSKMVDLLNPETQKKAYEEFRNKLEGKSEGRGVVDGEVAQDKPDTTEPVQEEVKLSPTNFVKVMTPEIAESMDYFEDPERSAAFNERTKGTFPSYFYKTFPEEGHVHIVNTDGTAEGNIVNDQHLYTKEMKSPVDGKRKKVILNFMNNRLRKAAIRDLETGQLDLINMGKDLPGDKGTYDNPYTLDDLNTLWQSMPSAIGLEYVDDPISSVELNMRGIDFGDIQLEQKTYKQHLDDVRSEIEAGISTIIERVDRTKREVSKTLKDTGSVADLNDVEHVRTMYGDRTYDDSRLVEHFGNGQIQYLPSVYNGKVGYLQAQEGQVYFVETKLNEQNQIIKGDEFLVAGVSSTETMQDLGVVALSLSVADVNLETDGRPFPIRIQGKYYKNPFYGDPSKAIRTDADGNPIAVTLLTPEGKKIRFKTPQIVHDLAMAIEMKEIVKEGLFKDFVTRDLTNAIAIADSKTGVEYAVYRKEGQYEIVRLADGKKMRTNSGIYKRVVEDFEKSFDAAIKKVNEQFTPKKNLQDEFRRFIQDVRSVTPEEALRTPDQREIQSSKGVQEEKPTVSEEEKQQEQEALEALAQQIAEEEEAAARKAEQDKLTEQATVSTDQMVDADTLEALGKDEAEDKEYDDSQFKGIQDSSSALSYIWFDRDNNIFKVNNEAFREDIINRPDLANASFGVTIDYGFDEFWDEFPNLKKAMEGKTLTPKEIDNILSVPEGDSKFKTRLDRIPLKLSFEEHTEGLYLHESGYPYITVPAEVTANLTDPKEILNAETKYKNEIKLKTRRTRYTLLNALMQGQSVKIPASHKTVGHPNTTGQNQNLADVLKKIDPYIDLRTVELAVAVGNGVLFKNGEETSFGFGARGNVFLVTRYTANGQSYNLKLNPAKVTREHGEIVLKALQQAGKNGLQAKYVGPEVTGGLTNAEVLNFLVRQGKSFTEVGKNKAKTHLLAKQLWSTPTEIKFGTSSIPITNPSEAQVEVFLDWITTNKNYPINKGLLDTKLNKEFSIGTTMSYNPNTDNYNSFLLNSGTLNTDVDVVPGTKSLTTNPVVVMDTDILSVGVGVPISKAKENVVEKKPDTAPTEPQETPTKPKETDSTETKEAVEKVNKVAAAAVKGKALGQLSGVAKLRPGSVVYFRDPKNAAAERTEFARIVTNDKGVDVVVLNLKISGELGFLADDMKKVGHFATTNQEKAKELANSEVAFMSGYLFYDSPEVKVEEVEKAQEDQPANTSSPETGFKNTGHTSLGSIGFSPFREVPLNKKDYVKADIGSARKWLKTRLNVDPKIVDGLIDLGSDRHAFGQARVDSILLSSIAERGTEYHEAFHRVSLFLLTDSQRESLYNKARKEYNMPDATDTQVEEELAERFRSYVIELQDGTGKERKGLLKSIADFFSNIWNYIYNVFVGPRRLDNIAIEDLFQQIEKGRFRYRKVDQAKIAAMQGKFANFEVKGEKLKYVQTEAQFREVTQNLFYLLAQESGIIEFKEGQFALKLSNMEDLGKLKFGYLHNGVKKYRDQYMSVAENSEEMLDKLRNWDSYTDERGYPLYSLQGLQKEAKEKYLGNPDIPTADIEQALQTQAEKALRSGQLFGEVIEKFDTYQAALEDFMLSLNIMRTHDKTDIDNEERPDEGTGETQSEFEKYNKASFESSAKHNTAANIKLLLSILPETNVPSEVTGLYKFAEFSPLWSRLLRDNLGTVTADDMMSKLKDKAANSFTHAQLLRHLEADDNLKTQFFRTIKKTRLDFINALINKTDDVFTINFGDTAVQNSTETTIRTWNNTFYRNSDLFTRIAGEEVRPDNNAFNKLSASYENLFKEAKRSFDISGTVQDFLGSKKRLLNILGEVGITLKEKELDYMLAEYPDINKGYIDFLQNHIRFIFDPQGTLATLFRGEDIKLSKGGKLTFDKAFTNERGIKHLAKKVAESDPHELGDSVLAAKGNRYYTISQHTTLTNTIDLIKKNPARTVGDILKATYNQNSRWAQFLLDPKNAAKLELKTMAAIIREGEGDVGREYQEISDLEEYLIRIIATNKGYATPPTPADRKFYQYFKGLPSIEFAFDAQLNINQDTIDLFKGYVMDEYNRIQLTRNQVDQVIAGTMSHTELVENIHHRYVGRDYKAREGEVVIEGKLLKKGNNYIGGGTKFTHFVEFNQGFDPNTLDKQISELLIRRLRDEVQLAGSYGIISLTEEGKIANNELIPTEIIEKHQKRLGNLPNNVVIANVIADNMVNNMMANIEMGKVFTCDPAAFKGAEDYVKRLTGYTSTGDNLRNDYDTAEMFNSELATAQKYNITAFSSHVIKSDFYDELVDLHTKWNLEAGIAETKVQAEKIAREKLGALLKVDQTDAQTYITAEMYKALSIKLGEWNEAKEAAYQALQKDDMSREDMLKSYDVVMQPWKMTYMKNNYVNGQSYSVFDKMSMATLFRPMIKGTQMEELLDRMEVTGKFKLGPIAVRNLEEKASKKELEILYEAIRKAEKATIEEAVAGNLAEGGINDLGPAIDRLSDLNDNLPEVLVDLGYTSGVLKLKVNPKLIGGTTKVSIGEDPLYLVEKFKKEGQLNPILLNNKFEIVEGRHRLQAALALGQDIEVYLPNSKSLNPIHQVKFHTAFKVGIQDRREIFDNKEETEFTDLTQVSLYEQDFDNLRLQLVTDPHASKTIPLGSQMKKMGISNVVMEGDYNNYGDTNEKIKGSDLVREVHRMQSELSNRGVEDFKRDMYFDDDLHITNAEEFVAKLREEARTAGMPDYVIESLRTENGDFYMDFDAIPGARRWLQTRLVSLIKKSAVDLDLPGNVFIQMSNIGLRKVDKSDDLQFFTEDGLVEAKVSVSLFKDVIPNYENKTHKERVDFLVKNPDLTAMGYRVPTQGQNSTYMFKIVDFLPENVGDVLVLPAEGTAIGGFDFDIDKMYIVRHNYENGKRIKYMTEDIYEGDKLIRKGNSTEAERAAAYAREEALKPEIRAIRKKYLESMGVATEGVEDFEDFVKHIKGELRKQMNTEIDMLVTEWVRDNLEEFKAKPIEEQNTTKAVQNRLLDMFFTVWLDRKHAAHRTQPLGYGAGLLQELSLDVRRWEGQKEAENESLKTVSPAYQLDVKSRFKFGKTGLGPYALANVHQILGQGVDLGLFTDLGIGNTTTVEGTVKGFDKVNIYAGTGENAVLSNFANTPFEYLGGQFDNVEQAFQEAKLAYTDGSEYNIQVHNKIAATKNPAEARKLGRQYRNFDAARWDDDSYNIMKRFIRSKFDQNTAAKDALLGTGNALLTHIQDRGRWGKDFPKILMEVRQELGGEGAPTAVATSEAGKMTDLSQLLGKDNEYITEWFSALVDAHVDIAADPYIYYLNVNQFTGNTVTLLLRSGVGGIDTMKFIAQPILKDIAKLKENEDNKLDVDIENPIQTIKNRYLDAAGLDEASIPKGKAALDLIFSGIKKLEEGFMGVGTPSKRTAEWYQHQLTVLNAFEYLQPQATMLSEAILSSRVDTKKFGNNMAQITTYENKVKKAMQDEQDGVGVRGYSRLYDDTFLGTLTANSLGLSKGVIGEVLMEGKEAFRALHATVQDLIGKRYTATERNANDISDEIYAQVVSDFFVHNLGLTPQKATSLVRGTNSIPKLIEDIKAGNKLPKLRSNALINLFSGDFKQDRDDFLIFGKPDDKWHKDSIVRAWKEILVEDREFGEDLFMYSYLTSGFKNTIYSFQDLAPRELLKDIGLDHYMRVQKVYMSDPGYLTDLVDEVFVNAWNNNGLVPRVSPKSLHRTAADDRLIQLKPKRFYVGTTDKGKHVYRPYIKIGFGPKTKLYRYAGTSVTDQAPIYYQVEKRSFYDKGFVVRENSFNETIHSTNKIEGATPAINTLLTPERIESYLNLSDANGKPFYPDFVNAKIVDYVSEPVTVYGEDLQGLSSEEMAKKTEGQDPTFLETDKREEEC